MCWFLYSSLVTGNIEQLSTPLPLFLSNAFDSSHSSPLLLIVKSTCLWRAKSFISNCSLSTYLLTQLRSYLLTYLPTHQSHHSKCHFSQWTMPVLLMWTDDEPMLQTLFFSFLCRKEKDDVDQFEVVGPLDKTSPRPNQDHANWNWVINL